MRQNQWTWAHLLTPLSLEYLGVGLKFVVLLYVNITTVIYNRPPVPITKAPRRCHRHRSTTKLQPRYNDNFKTLHPPVCCHGYVSANIQDTQRQSLHTTHRLYIIYVYIITVDMQRNQIVRFHPSLRPSTRDLNQCNVNLSHL